MTPIEKAVRTTVCRKPETTSLELLEHILFQLMFSAHSKVV